MVTTLGPREKIMSLKVRVYLKLETQCVEEAMAFADTYYLLSL